MPDREERTRRSFLKASLLGGVAMTACACGSARGRRDPERVATRRKDSRASLTIATCQFPVSGDVNRNGRYICDFIERAADRGADVVHFCETALSGYAGSCPEFDVPVFDLATFEGYDWQALREKNETVRHLARKHNLWVILGSTHHLGAEDKPTNCLYVISNTGRIRNRYDKMMCTDGDLKVYSPGNRLVTVAIKGVKCGLLICADLGNPNLYHAYRHRGVNILFHSYYNARFKGPIPNDDYVVPDNRAKSREHGMWIVANNSSARHSCWPTFVAGPDGYFRSLKRHASGMLLHEFSVADLHREPLYHTGVPSEHPRALNGRALP